jgi:hypothetical protein
MKPLDIAGDVAALTLRVNTITTKSSLLVIDCLDLSNDLKDYTLRILELPNSPAREGLITALNNLAASLKRMSEKWK